MARRSSAIAKTLANLEIEQARLTDEHRQVVQREEEIRRELDQMQAAIAALRPLVPAESAKPTTVRPTTPVQGGMRARLLAELQRCQGEIMSPQSLAERLDASVGIVAMQLTRLDSPQVEHVVGRGYRWRAAA